MATCIPLTPHGRLGIYNLDARDGVLSANGHAGDKVIPGMKHVALVTGVSRGLGSAIALVNWQRPAYECGDQLQEKTTTWPNGFAPGFERWVAKQHHFRPTFEMKRR